MQGLAQRAAGGGQGNMRQAMPASRQQEMENPAPAPTGLNDVVQMLLQGADPDELVEQGIPVDIIEQAIQVLLAEEEKQSQAQAQPQTEGGLAAMVGQQKGR